MIIWLDGTYGVGKTTVARLIEEKFDKKIMYIESDAYYREFAKKYPYATMFCGALPQTNKAFLNDFKKYIEENIESDMLIVMTLSTVECDEILISHFRNQTSKHYILSVDKSELEKRIDTDGPHRDKALARYYYDINTKYYVNYKDAIRIKTDDMTPEEVAEFIISDIL